MKAEPLPAGRRGGPETGPEEPTTEVLRILENYVEELERGGRPNADELLAQHPELAEHLRGCLASLEFLYQAEPTGHPESANADFTLNPQGHAEGRLGDFRILRQVGRGGMGVVYEAEQISLRRRVALKVLPFAGAMDPKLLQRFQNEAQAAAGLHHSNIVPVYAVGCERGVHYYAMQFIEGRTLAALIQDLRGQKVGQPDTMPGQVVGVESPDDADFILVGSDENPSPCPFPKQGGGQDPPPSLLGKGAGGVRSGCAHPTPLFDSAFARYGRFCY